jgi:4a-hydroxytetrahydrobiopterin dehydratase
MAADELKEYGEDELQSELVDELSDWYLEDGWIRREYETDGWQTTMMLVNAVGFVAEAGYHHPDLTVTWGKVWVRLRTHHADGITDKDLEMARKIEATALWRPPAGGALEGTPNDFVQGASNE